MGRTNGARNRGKTWQDGTEKEAGSLKRHDPHLSDSARAKRSEALAQIARLDEVRRVADTNKARLFRRAVPTIDYLILLSTAGVLHAKGLKETECRIDIETGEQMCEYNGAPGLDCRLPSCPFGALMRMRLITRLGEAYAREKNRLAERS